MADVVVATSFPSLRLLYDYCTLRRAPKSMSIREEASMSESSRAMRYRSSCLVQVPSTLNGLVVVHLRV